MTNDRDALDLLATVARLDIEHEIKHFLYLPTNRAAKRVQVMLAARGYETGDIYQIFEDWCLGVYTRIVPEELAIAELRRVFTEIAAEHGGKYDGWEADLRTEAQKAADQQRQDT